MDNWRQWDHYSELISASIAGGGGTASTATIATLSAGDRILVHALRLGASLYSTVTVEVQIAGVTVLTYRINEGLAGDHELTGLHGNSYNQIESDDGGALTVKVTNGGGSAMLNTSVNLNYSVGNPHIS